MQKTDILLESGTNELEILKFTVCGELYAINLAKVREIIMADKAKPVPHTHPAVEGIFKPRDTIFTVIDLPYYLTDTKQPGEKDLFIITNFNNLNIAFRVHAIEGIQRMSWEHIKKPDSTVCSTKRGVTTGITDNGKELVVILDFEKIVADIAPETGIDINEVSHLEGRMRPEDKIYIAEDSTLLMALITQSLHKAGYTNTKHFNNGKELWDAINVLEEDKDYTSLVDIVITDIEMPQMDGHRLTKLIKDDKRFRKMPVIIFSSLINPEMEIKGRELGASAQLTKPQVGRLVETIDGILDGINT